MARYAEHECDDCGVVLPSNQLYRIADRVLSTVSQSTRLYRGTKGGIGVGGNSRQTYKIVQLEVCQDCYDDRAARRRRAARAKLFGWVIGLALIGALIYALGSAPRARQSDAPLADASPLPSSDRTPIVAAPSEDSRPSPEEPDATPPATTVAPAQAEPAAAPPSADEALPPTEPDPVATATIQALNDGRVIRWKGRGERGFVTVSDPQPYAGRVCRNVYSTVESGGAQLKSPTAMWCQPAAGGEWALSSQ